ncbi:MAG: efflux RND transporter permease subunit, partial [Puniceicoccales bacterium]|nr:efflux RND transporter permease subunit [Puniceicoccales bacterium]
MNPRLFISRPILATVLSLCIVIIGLLAMKNLPIEQSPDITPPTVSVVATYPGASAEEVARAVATPIESQLSGSDHMLYFSSSSSSDGNLEVTVTFEVGTNVDLAMVDIQNRVNRATPQLPQSVTQLGITVSKRSPSTLGIIALQSSDPRYDALFLSNYATINFLDALKRVPGVGEARIIASSNYTMRIILDPVRMAQLGVSPLDISSVLQEQNNSFAAGQIGRQPAPDNIEFTIPVVTQNRLSEVGEFEQLIVRSRSDGSYVRLKDVSKITVGAESYSIEGRLDGRPTANIIVSLSSGANALDTLIAVEKEMDAYSKSFPPGVTYSVPYDTTPFISASIDEVVETLVIAMVLVFLVVFVFLQNWRATLIPCLTVPVSLVGTFAGMYALGFTINTLTLFGMVLAIGIVVDDAIVVLENVERHMSEDGLSPKDATLKAMGEITGPVIAIVLVLCSVFIPVAFLSGISGQLYRQFAITIAISVTLSGIVALTLCPALCAILLKEEHKTKRGVFGKLNRIIFKPFNRLVDIMTEGYARTVHLIVRFAMPSFLLFVALLGGTYYLLEERPTGFIPLEDQGSMIVSIQLPDGASMARTTAVIERVEKYLLAQPEITHTTTINGQNFLYSSRTSNGATIFARLSDWKERKDKAHSVDTVIARANKEFSKINEGIVRCMNQPPVRGLGLSAGYTMQILNRGGLDLPTFTQKAMAFYNEAAQLPQVANQSTGFRINAPKIY